MNRSLERILPRVQKPARYTGGEYNAVVKDRRKVEVRYALCFPDTYEIGMSNLGVRMLYGVMNNLPWCWCERVFAPWGDMEEEMRAEGLPLYGLESGDSIADFDMIGFSLGYEMAYTNVLNMLDLAGLPVRAEERHELSPIIVAGGTCAYNPEPLAPFVDIFSLGEGEDVSVELLELYRKAKSEGWEKEEFLQAAAKIPGLYVPSLYDISYNEDGTVAAITPRDGAPQVVTKRIVQDFNKSYFPVKTIVPSTEITQDKVTLEVFRGCIRGCRFCQAGYAYRPVRSRDPELLVKYGIEACKDSGYQEMTLSSLSTSDYRHLLKLCDGLLEWCEPEKVSLALPSLRADNFSMNLMAPPPARQEIRSDLRARGWHSAPAGRHQQERHGGGPLQFLPYGLRGRLVSGKALLHAGPAHRDRRGCAGHCRPGQKRCTGLARDHARNPAVAYGLRSPPHSLYRSPHRLPVGGPDVHGGVQAAGKLLRENMRGRSIVYNWHDPETSVLEAVFGPWRPSCGRRHRDGMAERRKVRLLERVFLTSNAGWTPLPPADCPWTSTPPVSGTRTRFCPGT